MTFLLDVNVLIALIDPTHVGHDAAHRWFAATGAASWATCPITENGVMRIVGHPKYPNSVGSPAAAAPFVARLRALPGHVFWNDNFSLMASDIVDVRRFRRRRRSRTPTSWRLPSRMMVGWRALTAACPQLPSAAAGPLCT